MKVPPDFLGLSQSLGCNNVAALATGYADGFEQGFELSCGVTYDDLDSQADYDTGTYIGACIAEHTGHPTSRAAKFKLDDHVRKTKGSQWQGRIVGTYSTELTPEGYAVESEAHPGSVQIYPASALELVL